MRTRTWLAATFFVLLAAVFLAVRETSRHRALEEPAVAGGEEREPGNPSHPFSARKRVVMACELQGFSAKEMCEWLAEATGPDIRIRPGTETGDNRVNLSIGEMALEDLCVLIACFSGLKFDRETGEFHG